ncbi:MAG: hypothetical protein Q8Q73_12655 [Stagnimonas sp.]|nr:hypothetical protein [Stagnimonas sp.]
MKKQFVTALGLSSLLAGCGVVDSGSSGYCAGSFQGGSTDWSCLSCSGVDALAGDQPFDVAIDNDAGTSRRFQLGGSGGEMTIRAFAPSDTVFPAGVRAGLLMRFPAGSYNGVSVRFNAYLGSTPVLSTGGGSFAVSGNVDGAGSDTFYQVSPTANFDSLEAVITIAGNAEQAEFSVNEFCGDR